jgi:arsenate reductase
MVPSGGIRGGRHKLGGRVTPRVSKPAPSARKHVLFVCIGNSCRSQMAEGFALAYGSDVMEVSSAGLSPAAIVAPNTKRVLGERNINIDHHFPKGLEVIAGQPFDIVVNMSGARLKLAAGQMMDWPVTDPIGQDLDIYRTVADQIEGLVMRLILELRSPAK